jgi:hypothetical protein
MKLDDILKEAKKNKGLPKARNFVAKHARGMSGAGRHEDKKGQQAKRERQKREWKREARAEMD